ncbi:MAG: hypothetical protein AWU57_5258, partial [Marinobacter sp. T13-3]
MKTWWFQIETAERRYSAFQKLPKGLPLRTLSRCCQCFKTFAINRVRHRLHRCQILLSVCVRGNAQTLHSLTQLHVLERETPFEAVAKGKCFRPPSPFCNADIAIVNSTGMIRKGRHQDVLRKENGEKQGCKDASLEGRIGAPVRKAGARERLKDSATRQLPSAWTRQPVPKSDLPGTAAQYSERAALCCP